MEVVKNFPTICSSPRGWLVLLPQSNLLPSDISLSHRCLRCSNVISQPMPLRIGTGLPNVSVALCHGLFSKGWRQGRSLPLHEFVIADAGRAGSNSAQSCTRRYNSRHSGLGCSYHCHVGIVCRLQTGSADSILCSCHVGCCDCVLRYLRRSARQPPIAVEDD